MDGLNKIRKLFPRDGAIYLVRDIDSIFDDLEIVDACQKSGIGYIDFIEPIHFRYHYENDYRDKFNGTLIIRLKEYTSAPFDIYSKAFQVEVRLDDLLDFLDVEATKKSDRSVRELLTLDSLQDHHLNYEETLQLLNQEVLFETFKEYPLLSANDYNSYGEAAITIGRWRSKNDSLNDAQQESIKSMNASFQSWLVENFDQLVSLPPFPNPKLVHQIPYVMNLSDYNQKKALIVMDGMSFSQWQIVSEHIENKGFMTETHPTMAWIPSVTSVSRQSIFSGKVPVKFEDSIGTTNKEEKQWQEYWIDKGYQKSDILYQRALGSGEYTDASFSEKIVNKKIVGCVVDSIDRFMHAAQQGLWSVHSELKYWLERDFLYRLLDDLLRNDFQVFMTADHGNIESLGVGRINQGVLANSKGERVRIYDDQAIRQRTEQEYSEVSQVWNSNFLPKKFYPLIAKENFSFIKKDDKMVSHGGTHIEEIFVPFVKVTR